MIEIAQFETLGLEWFENLFTKEHEKATKAGKPMLKKGAEIIIDAQKAEIENMEIVDTGDLINSIKAGKIKETDLGLSIDIYPQGVDKKGVRNAEKGYIAEFGKSDTVPRPYMTVANEKSHENVIQAMHDVWKSIE